MNAGKSEGEFVLASTLTFALTEIEQRLLGRIIRGDPGALKFGAEQLRAYAKSFQSPHDKILDAALAAYEAGRTMTAATIAAELDRLNGDIAVGILEYLRSIAEFSPASISTSDSHTQMLADLRAWRRLLGPVPKAGSVELIRGDAIDPKPIDWVWHGWLAAGKFHMLGGQAGTGKTSIAISIAAAMSNAGSFPDGSGAPFGETLIWSGEDGFADTILPRFMANRGCREHIHFVNGRHDQHGKLQPFDPARDIDALVAAANLIPALRLIIIDPIVSAVSGDSHKNAEVRRALQPLVQLGEKTKAAILGITHLTKGTAGRDPIERITGSLAFAALSRIVWCTARSNEKSGPSRLVRIKSNIGPDGGGFEYECQQVPVDERKGVSGQAICWGEALQGDAKTLLAAVETPEDCGRGSALEKAKVWLKELLATGMVATSLIQTEAQQAGHAFTTVKRAKQALGVKATKLGTSGGWFWQLPKVLKITEEARD